MNTIAALVHSYHSSLYLTGHWFVLIE